MLVINRCSLVVLLLLAAACGPESKDKDDTDWILGVFSNRDVRDDSVGLSSVAHYEFRDDGTLIGTVLRNCAENSEEPLFEYEWTRESDDAVLVELPDEDGVDNTWRMVPGSDCTWLRVESLQDGEFVDYTGWTRGAVCMKELPPCPEGTSCETCETVWCDEPPPPCEGESS